MPKRDELGIAVRFTDEQRAWLKSEAERLDRPMTWVVRRAVDEMRARTPTQSTVQREKKGR